METKTTSTVWQNETTLRLKSRNKMYQDKRTASLLIVCVNSMSSLQTACFLSSVKQSNVID